MININKNETVYTILRHVSRTGMTRYIDCYIIQDNTPLFISGQIAEKLNRKYKTTYPFGVKCEGTGMDMGYELVYSYAQSLFNDGYALKQSWL